MKRKYDRNLTTQVSMDDSGVKMRDEETEIAELQPTFYHTSPELLKQYVKMACKPVAMHKQIIKLAWVARAFCDYY